jgi:hypothetical protein
MPYLEAWSRIALGNICDQQCPGLCCGAFHVSNPDFRSGVEGVPLLRVKGWYFERAAERDWRFEGLGSKNLGSGCQVHSGASEGAVVGGDIVVGVEVVVGVTVVVVVVGGLGVVSVGVGASAGVTFGFQTIFLRDAIVS